MNKPNYIQLKAMRLRGLGKDERWLQGIIADNPKILGLGDTVELLDKERNQPSGGRLDILLGNDDDGRFELEVQLGETDETHIVRTIEYWDIERKRFPNLNHVAVIAAEEITGRFFNVINLFGNHIPLIALRVAAFNLPDEQIGLHFFKVLDTRGLVASQAEEKVTTDTDESYWNERSTKKYVEFTKRIIAGISTGEWNPNYNKYYIGIEKDGRSVAKFRVKPKKNWLRIYFTTSESEFVTGYITKRVTDSKIFDGYTDGADYRFRLSEDKDWTENERLFKDLFDYVVGKGELSELVPIPEKELSKHD